MHFAVPTVGAILPSRGTQYSCTGVVAFGLHLQGGTDYKCRLGDTIVSASYDSISSSVECDCAVSAVPVRVFLEVSLNGQQYTASGVEFEFMASNIVDMSAYAGTATGLETVDIHISFPGPPSLDYLCIWNGYDFPATYLVDHEYENEDGYPVGVARCTTPEADTVPYTQLRTAFEEPQALVDRRAELNEQRPHRVRRVPSVERCRGCEDSHRYHHTVACKLRKKEFNEGIGQTMSADAEPVIEQDEQEVQEQPNVQVEGTAPMEV